MATQLPSQPSAPIWVCVDCYLTSQGYGSELGYVPESEPLTLIPSDGSVELVSSGIGAEYHHCEYGPESSWDDFMEECECETIGFSWSDCEGCGSHLGGTRHAVTLWYRA